MVTDGPETEDKPKHHNRGGARPGAGRKPKPQEHLMSKRMSVRLTRRHYGLLEFLAEKKGVKPIEALQLLLEASMPIVERAQASE